MKKKVGVYYDFQNIYDQKYDQKEYDIQIKFIEESCLKLGKITIKNLYLKKGKYSDEEQIVKTHKKEYSYKVVFGPEKKDIDTLMTSDIMEDASKNIFDICVIISGDTDFVAPIEKIVKKKQVHVLCNRETYRKNKGIEESATEFKTLPEKCRKCDGEGLYISEICKNCNGKGELISECNKCEGTGWSIGAYCKGCAGTGWVGNMCSRCNGGGIIKISECKKCDGNGYIEEELCSTCLGLGKKGKECVSCGGTGVSSKEKCKACKGIGSIEISEREICSTCDGTGIYSAKECWTCEGTGKFEKTCQSCEGTGIKIY